MDLKDFKIGEDFYYAYGNKAYRCTDIGTRTVVAIECASRETVQLKNKVKEVVISKDPSWMNGPPYAIPEKVFDEYDLDGCYRTIEEYQARQDELGLTSTAQVV